MDAPREVYNRWASDAMIEADKFGLRDNELMVAENYSGRLLEVGCGNGRFAATLLKTEQVSYVRAIDISDVCIALTKKAFAACNVVGDCVRHCIEGYRTADKFDTIACWEVIEHLRRPDLTLTLFQRILAKDGNLVGSVPEGLAQNNPLHLNHYYNVDLLKLLSEHFDDIRIIRAYMSEAETYRLVFVAKKPKPQKGIYV